MKKIIILIVVLACFGWSFTIPATNNCDISSDIGKYTNIKTYGLTCYNEDGIFYTLYVDIAGMDILNYTETKYQHDNEMEETLYYDNEVKKYVFKTSKRDEYDVEIAWKYKKISDYKAVTMLLNKWEEYKKAVKRIKLYDSSVVKENNCPPSWQNNDGSCKEGW